MHYAGGAGYAGGAIGIWFATNGAALVQQQLHGPVRHLLLNDDKLYAATELGQHLVWDLRVFSQSYCDLLRSVWESISVTWSGGHAERAPFPARHPCASKPPQ